MCVNSQNMWEAALFSGKNYTTDKKFTRPSLQISTMDASIYWLYCSHSNEGSKLVGPHFLTKCKIVQQTIIILEEGGESPQERLEDHSTISIDIRKGRRGYLPQDEGGSRLPPHDWEHYREETPIWGRPGSHLMGLELLGWCHKMNKHYFPTLLMGDSCMRSTGLPLDEMGAP